MADFEVHLNLHGRARPIGSSTVSIRPRPARSPARPSTSMSRTSRILAFARCFSHSIGAFGRFVARAHLELYFNLSIFAHLGSQTIDLDRRGKVKVTRPSRGDLPDWIACAPDLSSLTVAEATPSWRTPSGSRPIVDFRHPKPAIDAFALDDDVDRDLQHLAYVVSLQISPAVGFFDQQCQLFECKPC